MQMQIKIGDEIRSFDPESLTDKELNNLIDELQRQSDMINVQLKEARRTVATEGVYADPDWYARATSARTYFVRNKEKLIQIRAARAKARKESTNERFNHQFVNIARQVLPAEQFEHLIDLTIASTGAKQSADV